MLRDSLSVCGGGLTRLSAEEWRFSGRIEQAISECDLGCHRKVKKCDAEANAVRRRKESGNSRA